MEKQTDAQRLVIGITRYFMSAMAVRGGDIDLANHYHEEAAEAMAGIGAEDDLVLDPLTDADLVDMEKGRGHGR